MTPATMGGRGPPFCVDFLGETRTPTLRHAGNGVVDGFWPRVAYQWACVVAAIAV
jgi:hypothetical protein